MNTISRRQMLSGLGGGLAAWSMATPCLMRGAFGKVVLPRPDYPVEKFGAVGDGVANDTAALQRALDAAGASPGGGRVVLRGGRRYLSGALILRSRVELHLADDATIQVASDPGDYQGKALLNAEGALGLRLTGSGTIDGQFKQFMDRYDEADEWWRPKKFRPRLVVFEGCRDLQISGVTFRDAPSWTVHLLGCEQVLVDRVKIRNQLNVPNCDGIDPDHCRDLEIQNCDIVCGDDAIVIKATRAGAKYGPTRNIRVRDCIIETQDSGLKIGTETTQDISDVRFERCEIRKSCRGLCIQLRDEGDISNVEFRDIHMTAQHFSAPWWGRGEALSFTAFPRTAEAKLGVLSNVRVSNVTARAENSFRIDGDAPHLREVRLNNVQVTLDRWTKYPGSLWDNRPTGAREGLEAHGIPAIAVRGAQDVLLENCTVNWGKNPAPEFTHALEAVAAPNLRRTNFRGEAAHPERDAAVSIS